MSAYAYGGFWWRAVAVLIDGIIIWIGAYILGFIIGFSFAALGLDPVMAMSFAYVVNLIWVWLYMALQESSAHQATIGKRCCRVFVTDMSGRRLSFGRASGRHFAKIISAAILLIGYFMAGWTEKKQGLHDLIAGSLVWRRPEGVAALSPGLDATT